MTIQKLIDTLTIYPLDMEVRIEFGIDHHVPIERIDEHHPEGAVDSNENYLLIILQ